MLLKGKTHKFGNDINTDYIISSKHKSKFKDIKQMSEYLMEDISPGFATKIAEGDFIAAGTNFGCGSSREAAPRVIQEAGISAVFAISFGRIFYRNAINVGLPVVECNTDTIEDGDLLSFDLSNNSLRNDTRGASIKINPLPKFMRLILEEGGLIKYVKKFGFKI
jgi:3-isopropylmalate/(R)-2-methylmalate dehydratase small subunit